MKRRIEPLYVASAILFVLTVVVVAALGTGPAGGDSRTGSVYDTSPGGAAALRRFVTTLGATTRTIEGASFEPGDAKVLVLLGASELVTDGDVGKIRDVVRTGGTAVIATELGVAEGSLLAAYGVRVVGIAAPGRHDLASAVFADPPARALVIDRGVVLAGGAGADVVATDGRSPLVVAVREGSGLLVVCGSLWPFLAAGLGEGDNARAVLALLRPALAGGSVAFDEYHHGVHPSSDLLVLVERTWPGRALVFIAIVTLLYLVLSGRRLGPPVPLAVRPARSSLEYVRSFAGLVRRSGHGEIARRRLRADLRAALARELGLDPATPFDRVLVALAARDGSRAARAAAIDASLERPLRDDELLRTVGSIDQLLAASS